ncbi:hypothetical protein [Verrucomicrobium spinosum]|uniref:hypothetical protein n=1 Tax=Verrucomicrobium spinosum TaxID=2736 RepID=UPI00094611FD|nr:hypothetical protein [Verrucomicrobium spinosum]
MKVTWGDDSGSQSESYSVTFKGGKTLDGSKPGYLSKETVTLNRKISYEITLNHKSTTLKEGPDYDGTLYVDVLTSEGGSTLPNPRVVKVDPDRLLTSFSDSADFKNKKAYLLSADVTKVSFGGTNYHELKSDNGTTTYSAPQWVDGNADGVAATGISAAGGDKNYPVAYTRNTKPQVGAELQIKDLPSGQTVKVKARQPRACRYLKPPSRPAAEARSIWPLPRHKTT